VRGFGTPDTSEKTAMQNDTSQESESRGGPSMARVLLLNDEVTPMEFVVHVLEEIFDKDHETAIRLMLEAHHQGRGECGIYPAAVADAKAKEVQALAREHMYPLCCVVEPVQSI
jgi:ATP-dependent Clp protease adaptor protein ClpS